MNRLKDESNIEVQLVLGPLSPKELTNAGMYWIKRAQACLHERAAWLEMRDNMAVFYVCLVR